MTTKLGDRMRRGRRVWGALIVSAGMLVGLGAPMVTDVVQAQPAAAHCNWGPGGLAAYWGQEWAAGDTCDWDNLYHGWLTDSITDGSCVWTEFIDAGQWNVQAYECTTGGWSDYWRWDIDGDYFSYLALCRNQGCWANQWVQNYPY